MTLPFLLLFIAEDIGVYLLQRVPIVRIQLRKSHDQSRFEAVISILEDVIGKPCDGLQPVFGVVHVSLAGHQPAFIDAEQPTNVHNETVGSGRLVRSDRRQIGGGYSEFYGYIFRLPL